MNTTLNDIITKDLKGRSVVVYEYDAIFIHNNERRISHWHMNNTDENRRHYDIPTHWKDLQVRKHIGTVVSVSGHYMDYEGTSITMTVTVDNEDKHVSINMEDTMEIIDGIRKHTMV